MNARCVCMICMFSFKRNQHYLYLCSNYVLFFQFLLSLSLSQECGCHCESCVDINNIHLHQEIEDLKHRLSEKEHQIVTMESQILMHAKQYPNGEMQAMRDSLYFCQDKYER